MLQVSSIQLSLKTFSVRKAASQSIWSQFALYLEMGQSILMTKKVAGCYEMKIFWFQIAWENRCVLDKVLTFN